MKPTLISSLIALYAPAFLVITAIILLSNLTGKGIGYYTRDPSAVMGLGFGPLMGLLSNLGILLWCATASCCLFAATLLKSKDRETALFLFFSGLLTTLLMFDDFFLFHEEIWVKLFHVGETVTYPIYGILVLIYLFRFRTLFAKTDFIFFILAILFFSTSMTLDLFFIVGRPFSHYLFEDGTKFLGIVSWLRYFIPFSAQAVTTAYSPISSKSE